LAVVTEQYENTRMEDSQSFVVAVNYRMTYA
jgi:hypothetical protein